MSEFFAALLKFEFLKELSVTSEQKHTAMNAHILKSAATLLLMVAFVLSPAQKKLASPRDSVSGKIGKANISINYGSPSVKGRKVWGNLVPYDQVWRAGANEATVFTTDQRLAIEGAVLEAGKYSLFMIPNENGWTVIFNKTAKQWGAYDYKEADDALRVIVKTKKNANTQERLVYKIKKEGVSMIWEKLEVPISVEYHSGLTIKKP